MMKYPYDASVALASLEAAKSFATLSISERLQVGCILLQPTGEVISVGYNHMPDFMDQCCEDADGTSSKFVIHAEHDAIRKCDKRSRLVGAVAVVTHQPCELCAEKLISAGVVAVVFEEPYRTRYGLDMLMDSMSYIFQVVDDELVALKYPEGVMPHTNESRNAIWRLDEERDTTTTSVFVHDAGGEWAYTRLYGTDICVNVDIIPEDLCNNSKESQIHNAICGMKLSGELDKLFDQ
ncbi:zinc-binding APOBEC/CMP deaminase [Vibrio phage 1.244.A._10N.261.54.C3]|nr:zinc-binding APOBEC/CMP deaminase [Vibrio phage 1.244.A._10N.261.54.C3]AUR98674.1 zinc-binding APOBEC/CMP deaminase [Vibrio phage 1.255.O._10N.286.45.F1]